MRGRRVLRVIEWEVERTAVGWDKITKYVQGLRRRDDNDKHTISWPKQHLYNSP